MTPLPILHAGLGLLFALAAAAGTDDPSPPRDDAAKGSPLFILLDPKEGVGLGSLLDRLHDPDYVLLDGPRYRELVEAAGRAAHPGDRPPEPSPESVAIRGTLGVEVADLEVTYVFDLGAGGSAVVPLRLDESQVLTRVREGERELAPRSERGSWAVVLDGPGRHEVTVALRVPIRSVPEGARLELALPESPATRLDLALPGAVAEAKLAGREPLQIEPGMEGRPARIRASLTPRPLLELTWRAGAEGEQAGPALLTAHGDVAVDVEPGSLRIAASYELRAERGEAKALGFRLEPSDELIAVEIDGQATPTRGLESGDFVEVPLAQPLRPGTARKLNIVARRHLPAGGPTRTTLQGFPLRDVAVQTGRIAVAQSGSLWVGGHAGQALRRVDPRSELPPALRVRATNVLAYQFFDQPFGLELQIDPSPPWVRVESRTTVTLASRLARVDARLDYQIARGRIFELKLALPAGLRLDSLGPDRWIDSSESLPDPDGDGGRVLTVALSDAARELGRFELHLSGRQDVDPDGHVEIGLFRPIDATTQGGHVAVVTARDVTAEAEDSAHFLPATTKVPESWIWPDPTTAADVAPGVWLLDDGEAGSLALRSEVHRRAIRHQATLDATIDRARVEVRQETLVRVDFGTISRLDIAVPEALEGRWDSEGAEVTRREPLGPGEDGRSRYRLILAREVTDQVRLRFRVRRDLGRELEDGRATPIELEPIRFLDGEADPTTIRIAADPGIRLEPRGRGWSPDGAAEPSTLKARDEAPLRLIRTGLRSDDGPAVVLASAPTVAALPRLVASRLWLRTTQDGDGTVKASASARLDVHPGELAFALPEGAELRLVHVGGTLVSEVERLPEASSYRIRFPANAPAGPVTVRIEYALPAGLGASGWAAPRLLRGGAVLRSFWEIRLPWRDTLVGVPSGWADENRWTWDLVLWSRRPRYSDADLATWVGDAELAGPLAGNAPTARGESQTYLFSRPGEPGEPDPWVASRAMLVASGSGIALVLGLALLILRPPARLVGLAGAGSAILLVAAWHPSVVLLLAQSAALGVVLTLLAWAMQRIVEHRLRGRPGDFRDSSDVLPEPMNGAAGLGSASSERRPPAIEEIPEGSTVIRPRPGSTASPRTPAATLAEEREGGGES